MLVVAPTVMASSVRAGDVLTRSGFVSCCQGKVTPPEMALRTAVSSELDAPPPRLMLATAGREEWLVNLSC